MAIKAQLPTPNTEKASKVEIKPFDMHALWRLGFWGSSAAVALAAVVIVTQSDTGTQRLQVAIANITDSSAPAPIAVAQLIPRKTETDAETRRLADNIRTLTADRDRLLARVGGLERSLDDMTGSIRAANAANRASAPTPAPVIAPPKTAPVATSAAPAAPPAAPALQTFPPPLVTVSVTPTWPSAERPSGPGGIGIDLGGAASIGGLRAQWLAIKAQHGPLLVGMQPVVIMRETQGGSPELRLIVGPLANGAAAAALCATLNAARAACRPAAYEGQRLATRSTP